MNTGGAKPYADEYAERKRRSFHLVPTSRPIQVEKTRTVEETYTVTEQQPTLTIEMNLETAAFVAAILGSTNSYEVIRNDPNVVSPHFAIQEWVKENGGGAIAARFVQRNRQWQTDRYSGVKAPF